MQPKEALHKKILVVDDFSNVRKSIKSMLQSLGVQEVDEADNGQRAAKKIIENRYDVILCDYNLGRGIDGRQLLYELRSKNKLPYSTIYVIITAETSRNMVMGAVEFEPDDYLAKPFALETLSRRLEKWLDRQKVLGPVLRQLDEGRRDKVISEALIIAKESNRYRGWAHKQISDILIKSKKIDKAEEFLQSVLQTRDQAWARFDLGRVAMARKEYEKAHQLFERITLENPNMVVAYDLWAECLMALGMVEQAKAVLEAALNRSSLNFERQLRIGDVAENLEDHKRAAKAYREVVSLAENTWQEGLEYYQSLLSNLTLHAESESDDNERRRIYRNISSILKKMGKKFSDDPTVKFMSRLYILANDEQASIDNEKTAQSLEILSSDAQSNIESLDPNLTAFTARVLYKYHQFKAGDQLIEDLKSKVELNAKTTQKIQKLQDEPISAYAREKAADLNKKGMESYEKKEYDSALQKFDEALQFSPRHAGLVLNYVQCSMHLMGDGEVEGAQLKRCLEIVDRLSYLPKKHPQFERYRLLRERLILMENRRNVS